VTLTPDDLVEIEQIKRLKYRYVRLLDLKEWDELADVFVEDATATYGGGAYDFNGRDEIVDFLRRNLTGTGRLTSHKVHQPEIDLTGPDTATGTWALEDVVVHTERALTIRGTAFYRDEYVKVDGAWRIRHTGYKRVYEELEPRPDDLRLTADWWTTDGRSRLPVE
jgi:uncharacterized protein (TIGR02246 family)